MNVFHGRPAKVLISLILISDDTKEYVKIFTNIDRMDQLQNYYIRCHKVNNDIMFNKGGNNFIVFAKN